MDGVISIATSENTSNTNLSIDEKRTRVTFGREHIRILAVVIDGPLLVIADKRFHIRHTSNNNTGRVVASRAG